MSLYVNNNLITACQSNGTTITSIYANGIPVWGQPGSQTFTSNGTFTVPAGITTITIFMSGGGGGGAKTDDRAAGGGWAGAFVQQAIATSPGATFSVTIGGGGGTTSERYTNGGSGSATYFGSYVAAGGSGGNVNTSGYDCTYCGPQSCSFAGIGTARTSRYNGATYYDGRPIQSDNVPYPNPLSNGAGFGGQASDFANGGNGNITGCDCDDGRNAWPGSYGSGGGGVARYNTSGAGGNGICVVTW